ncbi:MAG TPA: CPXCG motif-containing cysteine-rich protein [Rhodanobacteraceae bacterium]|nr:CPXCG motif-containing cysteine-rich protein [Rhodanobacteraceae bacterium]
MLEFVEITCPYCGESFETGVDASTGSTHYVEDCQVCCKPIEIRVSVDARDAITQIDARRSDE